jgi:hypothetical protein
MHAAKFVTFALAGALAACGGEPQPKFSASDITGAQWARGFDLTDHAGRRRTLADFPGKVVLAFFGYTNCPDACPLALAEMPQLVKQLGPDGDKVQVLFIPKSTVKGVVSTGRRGSGEQTMTQRSIRFAALRLLLAALAFAAVGAAHAQSALTLTHVHGLAYSADGKQLMVPSHHGLAVYSAGKWSKAPGLQHDYMGFAAARTHIYSSGHPAPGSGLRNPFGLIRSKDGGGAWDKLSLEGESDFHLLATGWNTNAVYVWNPEPNSRMRQTGLHYTLNDGFQWQHAAAAGLAGEVRALAVHPDNAKMVALATSTGIYVSRDSGASFKPIAQGEQGLSVFFDLDEKHFWYGSYVDSARLARVELQSGKTGAVTLPPLSRDAVAYIAQNPASTMEYAIATFERSIYVSKDAGKTWRQIADRGKGK